MRELNPLSPYAHELNAQGTDCADDCPACRWVKENRSALRYVASLNKPRYPHADELEGHLD